MPLYEYICENCGKEFEETYSISEREIPLNESCPFCKKKAVKKLIGNPGICDPYRIGVTRYSNGWKDVLKDVKKKNPGSKIDV